MKYLFSVILLALAAPVFGAIEFSEELEQFPTEAPVSATSAIADEGAAPMPAPSVRSAGNAAASNAAVTSAQSTGVVGSMNGPLPSNTNGLAVSTIRGGGGSSTGAAAEEGTDDLLAEAQATTEQRGGDTSSLMVDAPAPEAVSMPEPGTAIVWSLLAVCGFGVYRKRK